MFQDIFGLRDDFNVFLREALKDDFDLWKKEKEEVKKQESVKVEPFDLDKAYNNALAEVGKTVESSYNKKKLRDRKDTYPDVPSEIKTEEFSWSWMFIYGPTSCMKLGNGIVGLDASGRVDVTGSLHINGIKYVNPLDVIDRKYVEDTLDITYLPVLPGVKIPLRIEVPTWFKKTFK